VKKKKIKKESGLARLQGKGAVNSQAYNSANPVLQAVKKSRFYRFYR
jgi:hypothetical protein